MAEEKSITLQKAILHILDRDSDMPLFSDKEIEFNEDIEVFLHKHISRVLKSNDSKQASFDSEENDMLRIAKDIASEHSVFVGGTIGFANKLYALIKKYSEIPSADLVCVLFSIDHTMHLGILKFNYRPSYIHYVEASEDGCANKIIKQKTTLPNEGQKLDECAIIDLDTFDITLLEKSYELDGEKRFYFSQEFLECYGDVSDKQKISKFNKAVKDFNKRYFNEDFMNVAEIKSAVKESIDEKGSIDLEHVAENAFQESPEMKKVYVSHMKESGIQEKDIKINDADYGAKIYQRQKIKTDNGIEIKLPREYFKDKRKIEFINNPDGTISILLKNIGKLIDR